MRTTLTLDPDVARLIEAETERRNSSFKQVVNEAIRRGLGTGSRTPVAVYRAPVFRAELAPGVDPGRFNQLADELEAEDFAERCEP